MGQGEASGCLEEALGREPEKELFEGIMLRGMIIGYMKGDISDIFSYTERFLPKIDYREVCGGRYKTRYVRNIPG